MEAPNGAIVTPSSNKSIRCKRLTETNANRLHRIDLLEDGVTIAPFGASIPYYFTGHEGPVPTMFFHLCLKLHR
jgi:hypothetical protein